MELSTIKITELLTIMFGLFCVGISFYLSCRFSKVRNVRLAQSLGWQLLGEAIVGFVTVMFAITSWLDLYRELSPELVVGMRITIFTAASVTSINLYRKVRAIEKERE